MTCKEKLKEIRPDWGQDELDRVIGEECPVDHINIEVPSDEDGRFWCGRGRCEKCWDREISDTNSNDYITTTNEKEQSMTTKKTKAELEKELETVKESKAELEKELKNLEKYKQYEDMAGEIHALYTSFVYAGFSEEQAYDLLKTTIQNAGSININAAVTPSYAGYRCKK